VPGDRRSLSGFAMTISPARKSHWRRKIANSEESSRCDRNRDDEPSIPFSPLLDRSKGQIQCLDDDRLFSRLAQNSLLLRRFDRAAVD
jgi:hypothetical protein